MGELFRREPARFTAAVAGLITAILTALVAFGLNLNPDQVGAVIGVWASIAAIFALVTEVTRANVVPVDKAQTTINQALETDPASIVSLNQVKPFDVKGSKVPVVKPDDLAEKPPNG